MQARAAYAWYRAAIQSRRRPLRPILPADAGDPRSVYWRDHPELLREGSAQAERLLAGELPLLCAGTVRFTQGRFWSVHPITGKPLPRTLKPFLIDHLQIGDLWLSLWMNTLPWLPRLAQAWKHSGNRGYLERLEQWMDSWQREHWPVNSLCWIFGLDIAMRAAAVAYALPLLEDAPMARRTRRSMARLLWASGAMLETLSLRESFNHRIGEAFGLFCCGLVFRDAARGRRWIEQGSRILDAELERQFFPDGMHGERSPGYLRFVLEVYLHYRALTERFGLPFPAAGEPVLIKACEALCLLSGPGGALAEFGDDSDLNLFTGARSAQACLGIAAALFARPDFKAVAGELPPAAYALLGEQGYRRFRELPPVTPAQASGALPQSGFYVMRSARAALCLTGGAELNPVNGHSHADQLSLELRVGEDRPLVDAGSYLYDPAGGWRSYFRGSAAHSTVVVDGQDQAGRRAHEDFGWARFPRTRVHQWVAGEALDFLDAEHDGYTRLAEPVVHRRLVLHVKPDYWLIWDACEGVGAHECALYFQFAPGAVALERGRAVAERSWGRLEVLSLDEDCAADLVCGSLTPIRGWISRGYGHREPAPSLRLVKRGALPLRFTTLIVPNCSATPVSARQFSRDEQDSVAVQGPAFADEIRISETELVLKRRNGTQRIARPAVGTRAAGVLSLAGEA